MPIQSYKCGGCGKLRAQNRFSNTMIRKYQRNPQNLPRCSDCSGAPAQELKCAHCDVVKGLDAFSKQMRKNPDDALCLNCSTLRQDLEPDHGDQVQEEITMDRIRVGATLTNLTAGSTAISYGANSRAMERSNGFAASTNVDATSDWINPQIPIPDDPRARSGPNSHRTHSPSNASNSTYTSNNTAVTGTGWENFERTNAPYREQVTYRRTSNSVSSRGASNPGFVRQTAVKQDHHAKAQSTLGRQQVREAEQAEQAALRDSDDDSDSDEDPY